MRLLQLTLMLSVFGLTQANAHDGQNILKKRGLTGHFYTLEEKQSNFDVIGMTNAQKRTVCNSSDPKVERSKQLWLVELDGAYYCAKCTDPSTTWQPDSKSCK